MYRANILIGPSTSVVEPLVPGTCNPRPKAGTLNRFQPEKFNSHSVTCSKFALRFQAGSVKLIWSSKKTTSLSLLSFPLTHRDNAIGLPGSSWRLQT